MTRIRWTKVDFEVLTPVFSGRGAGEADGIRPSQVKSRMRFWYRAFAGAIFGDDIRALRRSEAALFGSALDDDRGGPGRIHVRAFGDDPVEGLTPQWINRRGLQYLLGQGLFQPPNRRENLEAELKRRYVAPGANGVIRIGTDPNDSEDVRTVAMCCLWALGAADGLGGRHTRGFGAIRLDDEALAGASPRLPIHLENDEPDPFGLMRIFDVEAVAARAIANLAGRDSRMTETRKYPAISNLDFKGWSYGSGFEWFAVLDAFGAEFKADRREPDDDFHTLEYRDVIDPIMAGGRPRDLEYPRAVYGLPVIYQSRSRRGERVKVEVDGPRGGPQRRESPLWIRPMRDAEGDWQIRMLGFKSDFLPSGASVVATPRRWQSVKLDVRPDLLKGEMGRWTT